MRWTITPISLPQSVSYTHLDVYKRQDLHEEKTKYFRVKAEDTLRIKSIDLKKSGRITLQVNNYNPFYWNAKVTAFKTPVDQEVGYGDAFNPFSVLAGGLGDLMSGLPKIDLPKNRGALSRDELDEKTFNYLSTVAKYASQYEDLQLLNKKVEDLQTAKLELIEPVSYTHLDVYKRQQSREYRRSAPLIYE